MDAGILGKSALPSTKVAREEAIRKVLAAREISSQGELLGELSRLGITTTQGTLSRDLLSLRATKVRNSLGRLVYSLPDTFPSRALGAADTENATNPRLSKWCQELLVSSDVVAHQVLLRTPAGGANLLASAIDAAWFENVLGCIAGDDTVLVICRDADSAFELNALFLELIGGTGGY